MSVCITMATLTQEWKVAEVGPGAKMFVVDLFWFLASEFMVEKFKKIQIVIVNLNLKNKKSPKQ